ncbi:MAG: hypothetical protein ACFE0Q_16005 [Anaerolineae bacterium]
MIITHPTYQTAKARIASWPTMLLSPAASIIAPHGENGCVVSDNLRPDLFGDGFIADEPRTLAFSNAPYMGEVGLIATELIGSQPDADAGRNTCWSHNSWRSRGGVYPQL